MYLHGSSRINPNGHLEIGGIDSIDLTAEYGTPLYVYDIGLIRERASSFKSAFDKAKVKAKVAYASKAFSSIAMIQLMQEEGLYLDIVSAGELFTALAAGFPAERIHFHGNNKSQDEIKLALEHGVGCIVIDNFHEIELLDLICRDLGIKTKILLRVTPGVNAYTHKYMTTGQIDSKFGFDLLNGQADEAIQLVTESASFEMSGFHYHLGSQIVDITRFVLAVDEIFKYIKKWKDHYSYVPQVLNLGGGFGIRYTDQDNPLTPEIYVEKIIEKVKEKVSELMIDIPEIWIEPGRSLVGEAGTTLYTVGSQKVVPSIRTYLAVDGGMSDNLRPSLYQAKHEAALANKMTETPDRIVTVAGKCCESGDTLIWDVPLPDPQAGDLLAVFCTGAYGYSMANNYNRLPRPAVVFVEDGEAQLVVKRETYEHILQLDLPYNTKASK